MQLTQKNPTTWFPVEYIDVKKKNEIKYTFSYTTYYNRIKN